MNQEEGEVLEPDDDDDDEDDGMDQALYEQIQRPAKVDDGMSPTRKYSHLNFTCSQLIGDSTELLPSLSKSLARNSTRYSHKYES